MFILEAIFNFRDVMVAVATMGGAETPLSGFVNPFSAMKPPLASIGHWALVNLILTIVTVLIMLAMFVTDLFMRNIRLVSVLASIVAIIFFVSSQDMTLPMGLADKWTGWHFVIMAAAIVIAFLSRNESEESKENAADEAIND